MPRKPYIPLTQQPFCCVSTCIQMILLRRGLPLYSQEEIGYELGLVVPKEYANLFQKVRTGKKPSAGWGTQINKPNYSLNNFFLKYKIPLKKEYFPPSALEKPDSGLKHN